LVINNTILIAYIGFETMLNED